MYVFFISVDKLIISQITTSLYSRNPHPPTISGQAENAPNYLHLPYISRRNPTRPQFLHKPPSKVLQKFRDGVKPGSKIAKISWTVITIPTRRRRNKDY